jgi:hypothetical protein
VSVPPLVVEVKPPLLRTCLATFLAGALGTGFLVFTTMTGGLPWTALGFSRGDATGLTLCIVLATPLAAVFLAFLLWRHGRVRSGRVELGEAGIVFRHASLKQELPWSEVVGFRDDSVDFVELFSRRAGDVLLTVPTPTERDRVAVLDRLVARGVPRVEGSS